MKQKNIFFALVCLLLASCLDEQEGEILGSNLVEPTIYFCGAENRVANEQGQLVFRSQNMDFKSGETQSADFAFEGEYGVKLDRENQYGMSFLLTDIAKGEFFKAFIWQKDTDSPGDFIFGAKGEIQFTLSARENGIFKRQKGWMKHVVQFEAISNIDSLTIFAFLGGEAEVGFFDNLEVHRYKTRPHEDFSTDENLVIHLPDSSKKALDRFINIAAKQEIIQNKYKKYVEGSIIYENDTIPIEMRLKGDWTDHLMSGNASYRIKTASGSAFKGLRSFSIQHPKTRNNMHEWFMHELMDMTGLLSTRYAFLPVTINGNNQGIYALEEHFDKQLLESRGRREGPILKIDESGFWALALLAQKEGYVREDYPYAAPQVAIMSCFKENRTLKSTSLLAQFQNGAQLLTYFRNGFANPGLIFDLEQAATYYALMDLGNVKHALAWHNRRFYYNPISAKLEHIGFDMIPMVKPYNELLAFDAFEEDTGAMVLEKLMNHYFFTDAEFRKHYTEKLKVFSTEAFLDSVFGQLDSAIFANETLMGFEIPHYHFDRQMYYEKAALIRTELVGLDSKWDTFLKQAESRPKFERKSQAIEGFYKKPYYLKEISVNAFRKKIDSNHYQIQFENHHFDSVNIIAYSVKPNKNMRIPLKESIRLGGFQIGANIDTAIMILDEKPTRFFFTLANVPDMVAKKKFIKWSRPQGMHPRIALREKFKTNSDYYALEKGVIVFNQGNYQIGELIYIPSAYQVQFKAGTTIDFVHGGGLILNGNTRMNGVKDAEIKFTSSDGTGQGVSILEADSVLINQVVIDNMGCLNHKGWTLTGALTIYEAHVQISDLTIRNNTCEDGVNLIRCYFEVNNCLIENTKSDGFDADFCTGSFSNSTFKNTGNDCIDFSGSTVDIQNITISESGDKGVSAGERSKLNLNGIQIDGAITGLASKDGSLIMGENITVKNAEVGLAVFRKKPEYETSSIIIDKVRYENVRLLGLVEEGGAVILAGKEHRGYQKFDIDSMYARFGEK